MPRGQFGTFDELENRRDLYRLIDRLGDGLPPDQACERKRQFLLWATSKCSLGKNPVKLSNDLVGFTQEVYFSLCALAGQFGLDLEKTAIKLERLVRKQ